VIALTKGIQKVGGKECPSSYCKLCLWVTPSYICISFNFHQEIQGLELPHVLYRWCFHPTDAYHSVSWLTIICYYSADFKSSFHYKDYLVICKDSNIEPKARLLKGWKQDDKWVFGNTLCNYIDISLKDSTDAWQHCSCNQEATADHKSRIEGIMGNNVPVNDVTTCYVCKDLDPSGLEL